MKQHTQHSVDEGIVLGFRKAQGNARVGWARYIGLARIERRWGEAGAYSILLEVPANSLDAGCLFILRMVAASG